MARETLVSPLEVDDHGRADTSSVFDDPPVTEASRAGNLFHPDLARLSLVAWKRKGLRWGRASFKDAVIVTALAAKSTRAVYDTRWLVFVSWCEERDLDPSSFPVTEVLEFLQSLASKKVTISITGYVTAISDRHDQIKLGSKSYQISQLASVQSLVTSLKKVEHIPRIVVPPWDLNIVLSALKKPPYFPLETAPLKELTLHTVFLEAITSARRVSEIHTIQSDTLLFHSWSLHFWHPTSLRKSVLHIDRLSCQLCTQRGMLNC